MGVSTAVSADMAFSPPHVDSLAISSWMVFTDALMTYIPVSD